VYISLAKGLLSEFPTQINNGRFKRACELGATLKIQEMCILFQKCTSIPVLVGSIHGDLHAENVRVRATDAIVIDFLNHRTSSYPLVYDAACLEASLLVKGFPDDKRDPQEWLQSIESLYEKPLIISGGVMQTKPANRSFWFHACVHQIRRYAKQWECRPNQYAGALAVALLNKAKKDVNVKEPEASHRAGAYVLAERVLSKTFGFQQTDESPMVAK
jgi:hypothetical protein